MRGRYKLGIGNEQYFVCIRKAYCIGNTCALTNIMKYSYICIICNFIMRFVCEKMNYKDYLRFFCPFESLMICKQAIFIFIYLYHIYTIFILYMYAYVKMLRQLNLFMHYCQSSGLS